MFSWRLFLRFGNKKWRGEGEYTSFKRCLASLRKALVKRLRERVLEEEDYCTVQVLDSEQVMWDYEGSVEDVLDAVEFEEED